MPTVIEEGQFKFVIYTRENDFEPPHVHVWVGNARRNNSERVGQDPWEVNMSLLTARVKDAERMMTQAAAINEGVEITFADGCKGLVPFTDISEIGSPAKLTGIELPNPYQINIHGSKGEMVELPWDFVRHYCDSSYRTRIEAVATEGMQSLGKRIRTIRESIGMTQFELATTAGIGRITEVRIENGVQSPRYETLSAIAQALKLPIAELLGGGLSD